MDFDQFSASSATPPSTEDPMDWSSEAAAGGAEAYQDDWAEMDDSSVSMIANALKIGESELFGFEIQPSAAPTPTPFFQDQVEGSGNTANRSGSDGLDATKDVSRLSGSAPQPTLMITNPRSASDLSRALSIVSASSSVLSSSPRTAPVPAFGTSTSPPLVTPNTARVVLPQQAAPAADQPAAPQRKTESPTNACSQPDPNKRTIFPCKVYDMLEDAHRQNFIDIVSWNASGTGFMVHNIPRFTAEIIPRYFKQSKYKSFQRQLSLYGFDRVTTGPLKGMRAHPDFIRGDIKSCRLMKPVARPADTSIDSENKHLHAEHFPHAHSRSKAVPGTGQKPCIPLAHRSYSSPSFVQGTTVTINGGIGSAMKNATFAANQLAQPRMVPSNQFLNSALLSSGSTGKLNTTVPVDDSIVNIDLQFRNYSSGGGSSTPKGVGADSRPYPFIQQLNGKPNVGDFEGLSFFLMSDTNHDAADQPLPGAVPSPLISSATTPTLGASHQMPPPKLRMPPAATTTTTTFTENPDGNFSTEIVSPSLVSISYKKTPNSGIISLFPTRSTTATAPISPQSHDLIRRSMPNMPAMPTEVPSQPMIAMPTHMGVPQRSTTS